MRKIEDCGEGDCRNGALIAELLANCEDRNATIERCAQVADTMVAEVAAAIRKLKDAP
jgi:hypothetical protein